MTRPPHPYLVLATAILLPGCGQVLNRQPTRGLMFLFFILLLGGLTFITAPPSASLAGHCAGGLFVYALSLPDAYRTAFGESACLKMILDWRETV
jgi:ABC-type transport system involved in cytochrome c biogenesis permease component